MIRMTVGVWYVTMMRVDMYAERNGDEGGGGSMDAPCIEG